MNGLEGVLAVLAILAATLATVAYVGWPLRRPRLGPAGPAGADPDLSRLAEERRALLTALRELERDRELGTLTDDDHAVLREAYERRALALYPRLDAALRAREAAVAEAVTSQKAALLAAASTVVPAANGTARLAGAGAAALDPDGAARARVDGRPAAPAGRGGWYALGAGLAAIVFLAGVGGFYYAQTAARAAQRPVGAVRATDRAALATDPLDPARVYLGTPAGLLVSQDRGASWTPARGADAAVAAVVRGPGGLLAAGPHVWLTSGDGLTWRSAPSGLPSGDVRGLAVSPAVPGRVYAALAGTGLVRSDDGGATWRQLGRVPASIVGLAAVPGAGDTDVLYAATLDEGVLASPDGGGSWSPASGFVNGALPTRHVVAVVYDGRSGDTAPMPGMAGMTFRGALFAGTDRGLFRSTDGGLSWTRLPVEADVAALALGPDDAPGAQSRPPVVYLVDTAGRVFRSADRGLTWDGRGY